MLYFITKLLDLKEEDVLTISDIYTESNNFFVTLKPSPHSCPNCGCITQSIKEYRLRKLTHKVLIHSDTIVFYKQRRYLCKQCSTSFIEHNPFGNSRKKSTPASIIHILNDLKPYTSTYSQVAQKYNLSVSTVINIFDKHVQIRRKKLPPIICADEFYFNRRSKYKYAFMIMDFKKKVIVDILESRWSSHLSNYFFSIPLEERNKVLYICIDMYKPYKDTLSIYFKNSTICIDSFHVMKKCNDSLNSVRKRIMRRYSDDKHSQEYKLLKYRYRLLLKNRSSIDNVKYYKDGILGYHTTENGVLETVLGINQELKTAYLLKERYNEFNAVTEEDFDLLAHQEEFKTIVDGMVASKIKEFISCASTLSNWRVEILNSFVWFNGRRISNGPIEGKNNYIKKIISNANGLSNFERARNKFIYSQNLHENYTINEHKKEIKRVGTPRGKYKKKVTEE